MHELSIALSILDIVTEEAERRGGARIRAVHLRVGPLSGVEAGALRSAYELAREGTCCDAADLLVEAVPVRVHCHSCAAERDLPSPWPLCCPTCGAPTPDVLQGRELEVVALEIE